MSKTKTQLPIRLRIINGLGVLFISAGIIALLFIGWNMGLADFAFSQAQSQAAEKLSDKWRETNPKTDSEQPSEPIVNSEPSHGSVIGNLYVPRFGEGYVRTIGQGTSGDIINDTNLGVGHYEGTQMPGEVGNFAVAAHRITYGGSFNAIDKLQEGDPLIVETDDGWYVYRFTKSQIVKPEATEVLAPTPNKPEIEATVPSITLTTCHPIYSIEQRFIAFGTFEAFYPQGETIPKKVAELL